MPIYVPTVVSLLTPTVGWYVSYCKQLAYSRMLSALPGYTTSKGNPVILA